MLFRDGGRALPTTLGRPCRANELARALVRGAPLPWLRPLRPRLPGHGVVAPSRFYARECGRVITDNITFGRLFRVDLDSVIFVVRGRFLSFSMGHDDRLVDRVLRYRSLTAIVGAVRVRVRDETPFNLLRLRQFFFPPFCY